MTDLDKAREWAEDCKGLYNPGSRTKAVTDTILSLPDQWVDAERLKAIIADMDHCLKMESTTDFSNGIDNATTSWRDALKALIAPKLPTLADMTEEERKACQWMQAQVFPTASTLGIITDVDEYERSAIILFADGMAKNVPWNLITPLPDLPKLQWPGNEAVEPHALPDGMRLADHETYGRVVVSPKDDLDGDYQVFCSQGQTEYGASWWYAHKSELTFLDGDQHV